ncbi:MAG: hypothetical protein ABSH08_09655 [Tepidisphaeraceae bacterium]|jgi:hypothetical protein
MDDAKRCAAKAADSFGRLDELLGDAAGQLDRLATEIAAADAGDAFTDAAAIFSAVERRCLVLIASIRRISKLVAPLPPETADLPKLFQKSQSQIAALLGHFAADLREQLEYLRRRPNEAHKFKASVEALDGFMAPLLAIAEDHAEIKARITESAKPKPQDHN